MCLATNLTRKLLGKPTVFCNSLNMSDIYIYIYALPNALLSASYDCFWIFCKNLSFCILKFEFWAQKYWIMRYKKRKWYGNFPFVEFFSTFHKFLIKSMTGKVFLSCHNLLACRDTQPCVFTFQRNTSKNTFCGMFVKHCLAIGCNLSLWNCASDNRFFPRAATDSASTLHITAFVSSIAFLHVIPYRSWRCYCGDRDKSYCRWLDAYCQNIVTLLLLLCYFLPLQWKNTALRNNIPY